MTVKEMNDEIHFDVINEGKWDSLTVTKPFCCDLLSIAMSKAPNGCAWVTVMGNINTLAVANLTEAACIIVAEGAQMDDAAKQKASLEEVPVFATELPIYEAALRIGELLQVEENAL